MLRIVPGMPMDGRGEELLAEALADGGGAAHLYVVRTSARARQLAERERTPAGCRLGDTVVRLTDLVKRLARRRTHVRAAIGDAARALLLDEIARDEAAPPLRGVAGLAAWLGRLFSILKQGDVFSIDHAFRKLASLRRDDPGTAEALRLFGLYQARLVELRLYDDDGLYLEVARDLGTEELPFDRLLPARRRLVVEGFYQTTVVERAIFEKLVDAFDESVWLVDRPPDTPVEAFGVDVLADLEVGGQRLEGDLSWLDRITGGGRIAPAAAQPVRPAPDPLVSLWTPAMRSRTELVAAADERTEARFLAERAAALVRDDPGASVVIAFPSDRESAALVQEACADAGLPLEVSAWRTLAECAPARALLNLLELPSRDFDRERVVAALRASGEGVTFGDIRLSAGLVDRVSRHAGVISGAAEWSRRLERLSARIRNELAAEVDERTRTRLEREARETAEVRAAIGQLIAAIPRPDAACTVAGFVGDVRTLVRRFGLDRVDEVPGSMPGPESLAALASGARARVAIADALEAYERSRALLRREERTVSEHVAALATLFAATVVPFPPVLGPGAVLVGLRELRGLVTDHLLVGGLNEEALPGPTEPVPLLDEKDAARAGARTAEIRRREAAHLLVQALHSPRKSLVLSRPDQRDGCEALPALALLAICEHSGLRETRAEDALATGPVIGRGARGRQAAAVLTDPSRPAEDARQRLAELRGAGPGAAFAWSRVRAERERFDRERVGRFEGMLEPAALPFLLTESDRWVVSPTRLDDYAKCPQYFFFKRILGLGVPDDVEPDVSARDRGSFVHRILFRFHTAVPAASDRAAKARELDRIAREELRQTKSDDLFAEVFAESLLRDLVAAEASSRPGTLRRYLDYEEKRAREFRPAFFEARFGRSSHGGTADTVYSAEPVPLFQLTAGGRVLDVLLTGSIDRVDVAESGGEVEALVLDYKTGEVKDNKWKTRQGLLFQLPLYAHVVPTVLGSQFPGRRLRAIGAAYYKIQAGKDPKLDQPIVDGATLERILPKSRFKPLPDGQFEVLVAASVVRAREVLMALLGGVFHPTALAGAFEACDQCDFNLSCRGRGEAARLARMNRGTLFPQMIDLLGSDGGADAEEGSDG